MKQSGRFLSRLLTAILSGTVFASSIPGSAAFVSSSDEEDTSPELRVISVAEGETSEYGLIPVYYVDENGNEVESDLIPDKEPRATVLPDQFDLRDYGYITSVKAQGSTGTCWAHAALAASESNMIMKGLADSSIDLSEAHLVWFTQGLASNDINDPLYGDGESLGNTDLVNGAYDRGGNSYRSKAALGRGSGVQLEENAPAVTDRPAVEESQRYTSYGYLVNSDNLDKTDFESIKLHLMNSGALCCSYYNDYDLYTKFGDTSDESYYNAAVEGSNHEVAIVGWDDNFSKDNFSPDTPPGDGAWIIKNSWGERNHNNGYFYMSYYDISLGDITSFEIEDVSKYNKIYQYDGACPSSYSYYSNESFTAANLFTAENNETISAAAFYTNESSVPYIISVYADVEEGKPISGTLLTTQKGTMPYAGYHAVELNNAVSVSKGTRFSIVVTLDKAGAGMAMQECSNLSRCSYFTWGTPTSRSSWNDSISRYSSTACIKALTRSDIMINSSNFPDTAFRNYVSRFDTDSDGSLSYSEAVKVSEMDLSKLGISDFTGIEFFTELEKLNCSYNPIVKLDISHNNILNYFICIGCSVEVGNVRCSGFTVNGLDMSKVSNTNGLTVNDSMFIPTDGEMSYTYYCGRNYTAVITLNAEELIHGYGSWSSGGDSHVRTCAYCGSSEYEDHSFGDWEGSFGEHSHICLICGSTEAEEHDFSAWEEDEDYHTHSCAICGITESSPHTSDKFELFDENEHTAICESCGHTENLPHNFWDLMEYDEKTHIRFCEDCGFSEILEHSFGDRSSDDDSTHSRTCPDCGFTETADHLYGDWETSGSALHTRKCSVCGHIEETAHSFGEWTYVDETSHERICEDCGQIVSVDHDFTKLSQNDKENHYEICTGCGYKVDTAHDFGDWLCVDELTHSRACSDCGFTETSGHIHSDWLSSDAEIHTSECTVCGHIEEAAHSFGEWTSSDGSTHQRICAECGYIETSSHIFGETVSVDSGSHSHVCEICGFTETSPHSFGEITYTDDENHSQTCDECGYVHVFEHNFSEWKYSGGSGHSKICTECKRIITMPHSFGKCTATGENEHSVSCEICGYTIVSPHDLTDWEDNGGVERIRKCLVCGYSETEQIDFITGDISGDGIIDSFDLVIARQRLKKDFLNSMEFASADVNHDGKFDVNDVIMLQDFILGKAEIL